MPKTPEKPEEPQVAEGVAEDEREGLAARRPGHRPLWREEEIAVGGAEALEALDDLVRYFRTNERRMRYAEFREMGLPIGSGIVESAYGNGAPSY